MDDLTTWLRTQIDKDEKLATAAGGEEPEDWYSAVALADPDGCGFYDGEAELIADQSPARVLREVEAKRQLIDWHAECEADDELDYMVETTRSVMRLLALPYADRPGYLDTWRP